MKKITFHELLCKIGFIKTSIHFFSDSLSIQNKTKSCTWVHVSSLGEFNTALPFLQKYRQQFKKTLLVTYFNSDLSESSQLKKIADIYFPLPFELPWAYRFIIRRFKVEHLLVFETEIWPVLLSVMSKKDIPCFNIGGYINAEKIQEYRKSAWLFRKALQSYRHLFVRNKLDKKNFVELGVDENRITIVGNLKLDITSSTPILSDKLTMATSTIKAFTHRQLVIVLASIHEGEIPILLPLIAPILRINSSVKWIIAPRYLSALSTIQKTLTSQSLNHLLFSRLKTSESPNLSESVLLLDAYGLLRTAYEFADIAVMGGSFIPWGGQNPLEPIAHNVTTLMGKYHHHFADIVEEFKSYIRITEIEGLNKLLEGWSKFPKNIPQDNGYRHLLSCTGASDVILSGLKKQMLNSLD